MCAGQPEGRGPRKRRQAGVPVAGGWLQSPQARSAGKPACLAVSAPQLPPPPPAPPCAAPTCFLRSSGSPAPPQAGAGCAGMARSGCLAAASSAGGGAAPHPLVLLIRFTDGSLPLFSFLQVHWGVAAPGAKSANQAAAGSTPGPARSGGARRREEPAAHFWLGRLSGLGAATLPSDTMRFLRQRCGREQDRRSTARQRAGSRHARRRRARAGSQAWAAARCWDRRGAVRRSRGSRPWAPSAQGRLQEPCPR